MAKNIYKCAVDGNLGRVGKYGAICGKIKVCSGSLCGAHGNTKCKHKSKVNPSEQNNQVS